MTAALLRISRGARSCFFFSAKPAVLRCRTIRTSARLDLNGCKVSSVAGDITDEDSDIMSPLWDDSNFEKWDNFLGTISEASFEATQREVENYSARHFPLEVEEINQRGISDDAKHSKIRIWWDLERCEVPVYHHAGTIVSNIRAALRRNHCGGPAEIWAYADMRSAHPQTLVDLQNSGVKLRHVPGGTGRGNEMRGDVMMAELMAWARGHPPPAVHMVMTGNPDDCYYDPLPWREVMVRLRGEGYDVLYSEPEKLYPVPIAEGRRVLPWESFLAGPTKPNLEVRTQFNLRYERYLGV